MKMRAIRPADLRTFVRPEQASPVRPIRVLVWQWGRRGAGPRFAAELAAGLRRNDIAEAILSLSARAEILAGAPASACDIRVDTYGGLVGLLGRLLSAPLLIVHLLQKLRTIRPDLAICAMAGPLDLLMAATLAILRVPYALVVHEAEPHPGDAWQLQYRLQRHLARHAAVLVALSRHVGVALAPEEGGTRPVIVAEHPPFALRPGPPPRTHGGALRVLLFGRLLRYKGLDLVADALALLGARSDLTVRVVGQGPEGSELNRLRSLSGVTVENRWVAETELDDLFAWSDVVLLSHRQASQSGVAAAALGAGRWIIATRVGGVPEQLAGTAGALLCDAEANSLAQALRDVLAWRSSPTTPARAAERWMELGDDILWAMQAHLRARTRQGRATLLSAPSGIPASPSAER